MMRSGAGIGRKPLFAPHQSSRRSQTISAGEVETIFHAEVVSGHPGSITSIHGKDAPQAFKKLFSLVKGSPQFRTWDDATLIELLATAVDVIIPFENRGSSYAIGEVWLAADAERRGATAVDLLRAA